MGLQLLSEGSVLSPGRELEVLAKVAFSITRNTADADDLARETLPRTYRAIGRFGGDGAHPRAWLFTIMRNAETRPTGGAARSCCATRTLRLPPGGRATGGRAGRARGVDGRRPRRGGRGVRKGRIRSVSIRRLPSRGHAPTHPGGEQPSVHCGASGHVGWTVWIGVASTTSSLRASRRWECSRAGARGTPSADAQQHGCTAAVVWAWVSRRLAAASRAPIVESGTLFR